VDQSEDLSNNKPPVPLPGTISSIRIQKNNPDRVSIFVDGVFLIGVTQKAVLDYNLAKGTSINLALYKELSQVDTVSKLEQYFLRLLARRMYVSSDLFQKAKNKDYAEATITSVIRKFTDKGWIDDHAFALAFARDKYHLNQWGPYKIKSALQAKGLPSKFINKAINEVFDKANSRETFEQLVKKRKRHFLREEDYLKRKKKVMDYLLRKGFSAEAISKHLDDLMKMIKG